MNNQTTQNTWQTELAKELRTQPRNSSLGIIITELEHDNCDEETISRQLRELQLNYFANLTDQKYYTGRARQENLLSRPTKEINLKEAQALLSDPNFLPSHYYDPQHEDEVGQNKEFVFLGQGDFPEKWWTSNDPKDRYYLPE